MRKRYHNQMQAIRVFARIRPRVAREQDQEVAVWRCDAYSLEIESKDGKGHKDNNLDAVFDERHRQEDVFADCRGLIRSGPRWMASTSQSLPMVRLGRGRLAPCTELFVTALLGAGGRIRAPELAFPSCSSRWEYRKVFGWQWDSLQTSLHLKMLMQMQLQLVPFSL